MTTQRDVTSEIKDALDREVARRFDTRRLLAGIERRTMRLTIGPAPDAHRRSAGPLGTLPVAVQWAGIAAAFLGAALGLRSLVLEWTRVAPAAAEARGAAPANGPLVADATPRRAAETPPTTLPRPARPAPRRAEREREPDRGTMPGQAPSLPAPQPVPRATQPSPADSGGAGVVRGLAAAPRTSQTAPHRTEARSQARAGGQTAPLIVSGPANPLDLPGLVGGVRVKSFRLGGKDVWPDVREVHEIGATLVMAPIGRRSQARPRAPREAAIPAFNLRAGTAPMFLLASAPPAPQADATGAYYARLFLGSFSEGDPHEQGLMGDGLQIVPLREAEVWGDAAQELFLRRSFGFRSVVAVDGARIIPSGDGEEAATSFVAGVGGQVFEVSLRGMPADETGLHTVDLRVSRQVDRQTHPESRLDDLEATLVLQNGRIVILGLPSRGPGRSSPTIAFLALSPRFDEFARTADGEEVLPIGDDVDPPLIIERGDIVYPPEARDLRIAGKVILQAVIRKDGAVDGVQVLKVPDVAGAEYLVEAAASSVRNWRYLPARVHGEPVNVYMTLVVEFALR